MLKIVNKKASNIGDVLIDSNYTLHKLHKDDESGHVYEIRCDKDGKTLPCLLKVYDNIWTAENEKLRLTKLKDVEGVPKLLLSYISDDFSYAILSKMPGLDLYEFYKKYSLVGENELRKIMLAFLPILKQIHEKGVVHADIKLENIMYDYKTGKVSIVDFDFRETRLFKSPERMLGSKKSKRGDMWAVGVTCYMLRTGLHPFYSKDEILFKNAIWVDQHFSVDFQDFLSCLLDKNAGTRYTCEEILNHPWLYNDGVDSSVSSFSDE